MSTDAITSHSTEAGLQLRPKPLLHNRTFMWVFAGNTLSIAGEGFLSIVVGYWVLTTTGSAKAMMTIMLVQMLAGLVLGSIAGTSADRYDRRIIMIAMDFVRALLIALTAVVVAIHGGWWPLVALLALIAAASQFHNPSFASSLVFIVGKDHVGRATSLMQITDTLARLAGLSLGGAAVALFGGVSSVAAAGTAYLISAICVLLAGKFPNPARQEEAKPSFWEDLKNGVSFMRSHAIARAVAILLPSIMIFFVASMMVFQVLAVTVWRASAWQFGMLEAIIPIGYASGAGLIAYLNKRMTKRGLWACIAILAAGPNLMMISAIGNVYMAIPFVFMIGFILAIATVIVTVMLRIEVAGEYQGRVFGAIGALSSLATPLGIVFSGIFSDMYGASTVLMLNGAGLTLVAALCVILLKALRHYD